MGDTNTAIGGPNEQSIPGESLESGSTVNLTANPVNTVVDMPNSDTTNREMNMDSGENCFGRTGCYNLGYSEGSNNCDRRLSQAENEHQQALSQLQYRYDQKIATNQRDCSANLTNEKARCNVQIENYNRACTSSIQVKNNEVDQCNKQLKDNTANMNLAVTQNVRTTITDLSTETRFCIRLTQPECQGQSSTCFWDASLTVTGQQGKGACISARFE